MHFTVSSFRALAARVIIGVSASGEAFAAKHALAAAPVPAAVSSQSVLMARPHDPPRILSVAVSKNRLSAGETVSGHVTTSSNVASVEARLRGYSAVFAKVGVGEFVLSYTIPMIAQAFPGTYPLSIIARNVDGVQDRRELPVTLR